MAKSPEFRTAETQGEGRRWRWQWWARWGAAPCRRSRFWRRRPGSPTPPQALTRPPPTVISPPKRMSFVKQGPAIFRKSSFKQNFALAPCWHWHHLFSDHNCFVWISYFQAVLKEAFYFVDHPSKFKYIMKKHHLLKNYLKLLIEHIPALWQACL